MHNVYQSSLEKIGLNDKEIRLYLTLLEEGEKKISELLGITLIKRGDLYYALDRMTQMGLVEKRDKKKKLHFRLAHPHRVEELIEQKEKEIRLASSEISALMPSIISTFNLSYHQPGVKVFEGEDGLERLVMDSLTTQGEVLAYIDIEAIIKMIPRINQKYYKERRKKGIFKRNLVSKKEFSHEFLIENQDEFTEVRVLEQLTRPYKVALTIYDDKISYYSLVPGQVVGLIIEDEAISSMQRELFELNWLQSRPLGTAFPFHQR